MTKPLTPAEQLALGRILYGDETEAEQLARIVGTTNEQAARALALTSPAATEPVDAEQLWEQWSARCGLDEPAADDGDAELERLLW